MNATRVSRSGSATGAMGPTTARIGGTLALALPMQVSVRMLRMILLVALACVVGCHKAGGSSPDAGVCPDNPTCGNVRSGCIQGNMFCDCQSGELTCRSVDCPPPNRYGGTVIGGTACSTPGLRCLYGLEDAIVCVAPENVWVFCGGVPNCGTGKTGELCCGGPLCGFNSQCMCGFNNHVVCADADGGT